MADKVRGSCSSRRPPRRGVRSSLQLQTSRLALFVDKRIGESCHLHRMNQEPIQDLAVLSSHCFAQDNHLLASLLGWFFYINSFYKTNFWLFRMIQALGTLRIH
uniref:Uncharacterized protein n=1 Tax=Oryza nivara TaxID=4536 RepID=A0A0E0IW63_ORYNI